MPSAAESPCGDGFGGRNSDAQDTTVVTLADVEKLGVLRMSVNARGYYQSGADQQQTLRENICGFRRLRLLPKMLRDVSHRDMTESLLNGQERIVHADWYFTNSHAEDGTSGWGESYRKRYCYC
ncbi:hypothetical protein HPB48_000101 [Haemaphysalis longicornis]|uniref:FMN-dependent dehydrogenase domain-containing protein n=1 Tax=Haemaphysalis longicornis TaxID=44386 RepID=A0A9J6GGX4_HAELO|nr:hypothetical protein HPB48_000101 [Haemaphysalis longicornis]